MKATILAVLVAIVASGCAVRTSSGTHYFLQRGIVLQLIHTCTDLARVYQGGRGLVSEVAGATPVDIPLDPTIPGEQMISVTVQSINTLGRVSGTYLQTLYIDSRSTTTQSWIISDGYGGGGGRQSQCPRQ
mgnify:CR=1 FL=1